MAVTMVVSGVLGVLGARMEAERAVAAPERVVATAAGTEAAARVVAVTVKAATEVAAKAVATEAAARAAARAAAGSAAAARKAAARAPPPGDMAVARAEATAAEATG